MLWKTGASQNYDTVFSCDAGAPFKAPYQYSDGVWGRFLKRISWRKSWLSQFMRMTEVMINQQRALRKRWFLDNLISPESYNGAYWGIDVNIEDYPLDDPLVTYTAPFQKLKELNTQLRPFSKTETVNLVHWGYALADAALRGYYDKSLRSGELPELNRAF
jgi:NTE family protein